MASIGDCIVNENLPFCRTPSRSSPSSKTIDTRPPLSARTRHANRRNAPIAATPPPTVALVATVNARARSPLATSKAETTNKKRKTVANLVEETDATPPSKQKLPVTVRTPSRHSTPFTPSSISDTVTPLLDGVTPHLILQRLQAMFKNEPIDCSSIRTLPCVSARLFACYAIYLDWTRSNLLTTPGRPTRNSTPAMQYTKPLQSLMTAMVRVELIGLDHESVSVSGSGNRPHQTKQISFRAFDCSSTLPPVDRVHGSDGHQQASIHALESANQAVHDIIRNTSDRDVLVASLDSLVDFLNQASCQQSSSCLWDQLAASISLSFHPRRIRNTIRDYLQEFSALRTRMIDSVMDSTYPVLMAEQRFAELVGQAIRFQLRMLLNEKPPRLSPQDLDYDLWSQRYSKVNDLIVMELSEGQSNGSVDDGCISALVSNALCVLYEFFGPNFLDHSTPTLTVPTVFCQLPSSNQGITREKGRSSNGLTTNLTNVVRDIEEACSFLAAAQATVFLRDLWTAPGVAREISRRGGWTETEDYATMSWKFDLWKLCPNDAHLVVLSNHTALFQRLEHLATRMMTPQRDCQSALQALETRFRLRTKQASLLSRYPEIGVAAETLQQGLAVANFPTVRSANTTI